MYKYRESPIELARLYKKRYIYVCVYRRPLFQGFSHAEVEIIVYTPFDQGDHVNRLEHVVHNS